VIGFVADFLGMSVFPVRRILMVRACALTLALVSMPTWPGKAQVRSGWEVAAVAWGRVPAGTFQMGCVPSDDRCGSDETPRHAVTLTRPFDLMTTEVTVEMYRTGGAKPDMQPAWSTSPKHPVVAVTWNEADGFCHAMGARLPTEAEWEYAARGGRENSVFTWGDQAPIDKPGAPNGAAAESDAARPVASFGANAFGLYDMAGNVWEWTADWASIYDAEPATDPTGMSSGRVKIVRGGSYGDDPSNLRLSNRTPNQPASRNINVGFRCARDVP
jgi:formylglycine-generating enzyme required for sulfatase activity